MNKEYYLKIRWGFDFGSLVFLVLSPFALTYKLMGFNPLGFLSALLNLSLIIGILFGSEIKIMDKQGNKRKNLYEERRNIGKIRGDVK
jgi:hypothetical protein